MISGDGGQMTRYDQMTRMISRNLSNRCAVTTH